MTAGPERNRAHLRLAGRVVLMVAGSFAFGYALLPLYAAFCAATGLGDSTRAWQAGGEVTDDGRIVTIEFLASDRGGDWAFGPAVSSMQVHPGRLYEATYVAQNLAGRERTGQAVPSVAPASAARYFQKTECFCFTPQQFAARERREMPVRFILDRNLPPDVERVTLSYDLFDTARPSIRPLLPEH